MGKKKKKIPNDAIKIKVGDRVYILDPKKGPDNRDKIISDVATYISFLYAKDMAMHGPDVETFFRYMMDGTHDCTADLEF